MNRAGRFVASVFIGGVPLYTAAILAQSKIGSERAVAHYLDGGAEYRLSLPELVSRGRDLFSANWTNQDGAGRPLSKGTGQPLVDRTRPLQGLRMFNRVSGPDANSCAGCHRGPFNTPGGSGDIVASAFEGAERFDFVTFDRYDLKPTRGSVDEHGRQALLNTVGNERVAPDLRGAGYLEMLAREMTVDLRRIRDSIALGRSKRLTTKGVTFGTLRRRSDGSWDVASVEGLPPQSLVSSADTPPSLIIRPWSQSAGAVSLREITNTSYNQHLGVQSTERFGVGTDPDGDGVVDEMTRGDVTAVAMFEATLAPPGRVIPNDPVIENAIAAGEQLFQRIGCTTCHVPALPLSRPGQIYAEPGPFNPPGNLRVGQARPIAIDLMNAALPQPRLVARDHSSTVDVPAYTDFKLHDITDPADASAQEPLDLNQSARSLKFIAGNRRFLTRRLWGIGNQPPYWHDGRFTTIRQAVMAHGGEAINSRRVFEECGKQDQVSLIEFLRSLQALPSGTRALIVDEHLKPKR